MRLPPLLIQPFFIALAAFGFWEIILSSGHPTNGTGLAALAKPICSPLQPGNYSSPQPHAPGGVKLEWLGQRGGVGCKLVNVFGVALSPTNPSLRTFTLSFLSTLPSLIFILHLSSFHHSPSLPSILPLPTLIDCLYQLFSAGAIIPLFASLGLYSQPARQAGSGSRKLTSLEVEGLTFGVILGAIYPSWKIAFDSENQEWIMAWQFFPLAVWVLQKGYVGVAKVVGGRRNENDGGKSVRRALRMLYAVGAGSSLVGHVPIVYGAYTSRSLATPFFASLATIYIPDSLLPSPMSLAGGIHRLLQYILIVAFVAIIAVLTIRLRQPLLESASFVMMTAQATLFGGPGFALMGAWWWVEERGWSET